MKKYRVGIVGMGFIGCAHADALHRLGNVEIAAVCDEADMSRRKQIIQDAAVYRDYKEMFEKEQLDAVHICTPNKLHFPVAKEALKRGIAAVCEKPFTWSLAEAEELAELAEKGKVPNYINYCNRFYPMVRELKSRISKGALGELISAEGGYWQDCLLYDTDFSWRMLAENSGKTRTIGDLGSHWFDLLEHLTGQKVTAVLGQFKVQYSERKRSLGYHEMFKKQEETGCMENVAVDTEDMANVLFKMDNGAVGNAMFSQMCAGRKNELWINLDGTQASFNWNLEKPEELRIGKRGEGVLISRKDAETLDEAAMAFAGSPAGHTEGFADAIYHGFRQFYDSMEKGKDAAVYADFQDGCRSMLLNEKIYESACKEQWVRI